MNKHNELQTAIDDFFSQRNFIVAHQDLQMAIQSADSQDELRIGPRADLKSLFDGLYRMLDLIVRFQNDERCRVADIRNDDENIWQLAHKHLYCNAIVPHSPWDEFPRYLYRIEFLEPSLIFSKCSSFQFIDDWNVMFRHFYEYAFSKKAIREIYPNTNFYKILILLHKFIDAIHLVKIRSQLNPAASSKPGIKHCDPVMANNMGNKTTVAENWDFINAFFGQYELENTRSALWKITRTAITNPSFHNDADCRTNIIDLYEELLVLLEKTYQLNKHHQQFKNHSTA